MGWALTQQICCLYKKGKFGQKHTPTKKQNDDMKTGLMLPQAKKLPEAREKPRTDTSWGLQRQHGLVGTLIPDFWPLEP